MTILGEEKRVDFFGNGMEITIFNGFSCVHQMKMILVVNFNNKGKTNMGKDIEYSCHGM